MPTGIEIQEEATANMPSKEWKQKRYKRPWVQGDTILSRLLVRVIGQRHHYK